MGRRTTRQALDVWMNGEYVARWTTAPGGSHELAYAPAWIDSPLARPLSLSLPLRPASQPYRGAVVRNYFDNLLPDKLLPYPTHAVPRHSYPPAGVRLTPGFR